MARKIVLIVCWGVLAIGSSSATAQVTPAEVELPPVGELPGFDDPLNPFPAPGGDYLGPRVDFTGVFQIEKGTREGKLSIQAIIQPAWHIYSLTQADGGPQRTTITVTTVPDFQVVGDFDADRDPLIHHDPVFPGVDIEEFSDEVTWTVPIRLAEGVDPESLLIHVEINGQVCTTGGVCELVSGVSVQAKFAGYLQPKLAAGGYSDPGGNVKFVGHIEPKIAAPGDTVNLVLTANLQPAWHVYSHALIAPEAGSRPTLIVLRKVGGWGYGEPEASVKPKEEETGLEDEPVLYYHEGTVTWTIPIYVPKSAQAGEYPIAGGIAYQVCTDGACEVPTGADFEVEVAVSTQSVNGRTPLSFSQGNYGKIAKEAKAINKNRAKMAEATKSSLEGMSVITIMGIAFLAGLILNVMPCVLPVIGLKIMSFVHQAGGSRGEILALNIWFSLGLLSVFWILGAAAAIAGHTWGEHFGDMRFLVVMIGVVFAFGLSFLGVWEIPIPGFVGSGKMQGAAAKEGAMGAFTKGMLSTVLATPCAGPLIAPAVGWAVKQPSLLTMTAFTCIGFGMAAPYLLVGIAPGLVKLLPKPGAWMETFKQLMGFLLMATVIFLFLSVPADYVVPTLTVLLGIAIACWFVGRTPMTSELSTRVKSWATGLLLVAASAVLGFIILLPSHRIDWQPFTRVTLDQHLAKGSTVLIDFTANW